MIDAQRNLNARYTYRAEGGENWRILKDMGPIHGDCEDYSLTLIWLAEDQSMIRFWLALLTFKYVFWQCTSPGGGAHAVLWMRGIGWTDNIQRSVIPTRREMKAKGYKLHYPILLPVVVMKFVLRPILRK